MNESHKQVDNKYLKLIEMDSDEQVVCFIKKHPIGLLGIYITGILIAFTVFLGGILFASWYQTQPDLQVTASVGPIVTLISVLVSLLVIGFTYVAGFIYSNNVIIVTNEKIAQVLYKNLVDRKTSQLSLGDLQDVTVDQKGLFARIFKYGTLVIETAGEQNNYNFTYAPYPYEFSKSIVLAREHSIEKYGN